MTLPKRRTVAEIRAAKGGTPIVCLTAYSAPMARALDPHVDLLLVGDSLGMVLYGFDSTLPVTLEMMIAHGAAVVRGSTFACVIVDLPFGSYQQGPQQAFASAARVLAETGAQGVKLEGGVVMAETIRFLVDRGVPVIGHVGLMPQSVNVSGFRATGRTEAEIDRVSADAHAVAAAGASAVVLEGTLEPVARQITSAIAIPSIGIGASPQCDGQILVSDDMLGLFNEFVPRFVRRYADLGNSVADAASRYAADVRARSFPGVENCFFPRGARPPSPR